MRLVRVPSVHISRGEIPSGRVVHDIESERTHDAGVEYDPCLFFEFLDFAASGEAETNCEGTKKLL